MRLSYGAVLGVAIFAGLVAPVQSRAQSFADVTVRAIQLSDGIYMLTGRGGNIGLSVGADGAYLIDDQFAPLTEKILAAVAAITDQPIRFVINTHWHQDHTGGNENLGNRGAVILAHDHVRRRLLARNFPDQSDSFVSSPSLPVITFNDVVTLHLNGESVRIFKVPAAHTDGDVIVHFTGSNVIHMGDLFFNGLYTFFDRSSGGSFDGMIAALSIGLELADEETRIIPGHGPLATRRDLEAHRDRMVEIRARTLAAIEAGTSVKDFIAAEPTADLAAAYDGTYQVMKPEKFLEIVYQDLSQ